MVPLMVECRGKRVVIFGGGEVAARKAGYFFREADVHIVSRSFSRKVRELGVQRHEMDVGTLPDDAIRRLLGGAFLAIGALSDPEQNNRIGRICREHAILFNNADGEPGDVILPAVSRGTHYTIAVCTGGRSPAVSRFLREHLEQTFPSLDAMVAVQKRLRGHLKESGTPQERRNVILTGVLHDPVIWDALGRSTEEAWEQLVRRHLHA